MTREEFQTERTRIISEMLDNPDEYGIYPTTKCFEQLDALFDSLSLPPAEGAVPDNAAEQNKRMREWFKERTGLDDTLLSIHMEQIDVMLKGVQQQPTAEGTGKTCHAKEMEYNHNMCAMQESCEKCEAYKVPTNEGDIAKTETDTGRIVDMPDLSQPTAEGAEAIVKKYEDEYDFKFHWVQRDRVIRMMREFAAQQQPTAEGAEKLSAKKYLADNGYGSGFNYTTNQVAYLMQEFTTLHAQRIAEKMVSDMLRGKYVFTYEELRKVCCDFFRSWWNTPGSNTDQGFDVWALKTGLKK